MSLLLAGFRCCTLIHTCHVKNSVRCLITLCTMSCENDWHVTELSQRSMIKSIVGHAFNDLRYPGKPSVTHLFLEYKQNIDPFGYSAKYCTVTLLVAWFVLKCGIFNGRIAYRAMFQYLICSKSRFVVFFSAPQEEHVTVIKVKFQVKVTIIVRFFRAIFHLIDGRVRYLLYPGNCKYRVAHKNVPNFCAKRMFIGNLWEINKLCSCGLNNKQTKLWSQCFQQFLKPRTTS